MSWITIAPNSFTAVHTQLRTFKDTSGSVETD